MAFRTSKKSDPLQKKVPRNPKYEDLLPTIDTGASISKYMRKIEDIEKNYRYSANENFKRMKLTTFVQLVLQVEQLRKQHGEEDSPDGVDQIDGRIPTDRDDATLVDDDAPRTSGRENGENGKDASARVTSAAPSLAVTESDFGAPRSNVSTRSNFVSVINGVGEYDVVKRGTAPATELAPGMQPQEVSHREAALARRRGRSLVGGPAVGGSSSSPETSPTKQDTSHQHQPLQPHQHQAAVAAPPSIIAPSSVGPAPFATREFTSPFLLLDVRDPDEYDRCHIISAYNYPMAMISRAFNSETKELVAYRNQPGRIIVLYDEDERLAPKMASTLVERGYDNLFMLSGGIKLASKLIPDGMYTGLDVQGTGPVPPGYFVGDEKEAKRTSGLAGGAVSGEFGTSTARSSVSAMSVSSAATGVSSVHIAYRGHVALETSGQLAFADEDLERLHLHLDRTLVNKATPSGRTSQVSRHSCAPSEVAELSSRSGLRTQDQQRRSSGAMSTASSVSAMSSVSNRRANMRH